MNVHELIEALSALDPDLPVIMPSWCTEDYCEVAGAFADLAMPHPDGGLMLADERDKGTIPVARLFEPDD